MFAKVDLLKVWQRPAARLLAGTILLLLGFLNSNIPAMIANQSWPSTEGMITSRTILAKRFEEYDGDYYTLLEAFIRYQYQVDGITYSSTTVNAIQTRYHPYETALRYPEGKQVQVFYDPRDPAQAVLEPGWVLSRQALGFFPTIFLLFGIYLLVREGWLKFHPGSSRPE